MSENGAVSFAPIGRFHAVLIVTIIIIIFLAVQVIINDIDEKLKVV